MQKEEIISSISDILRGTVGHQFFSESPITIGVLLMMEKQKTHTLKQLVQSQNMEDKIKEFIGQIGFEGNMKKCMWDQVHTWIQHLSSRHISDILLLLDKGLINNKAHEIMDAYISLDNRAHSMLPTTPHSINHIVENYFKSNYQEFLTFYDGTAGYGIPATSLVKKYPNVELNLQEVSLETAAILEIRLHLLNVEANITVADVLEEPMKKEGNQMQQFDFVSMSPPWGLKLSEAQVSAMNNDPFNRYVYGIPSRSQGDLAFVSCGLSATKSTGKAAFWLPAGTLFRSGPEQKIRQRLIDLDLIEAIVLLPGNLLATYSSIESVLLLCNKDKAANRKGKILMINASKLGTSSRRETYINDTNLQLLDDILNQGSEQQSISQFVMNNEVKNAQLSPETYVYKEEIKLEEFGNVKVNLDVLNDLKTLPLKDMAQLYRGYNVSSKDEDENGEYAVLKISDIVNSDIQLDKLNKYNIRNNAKIDNNRILNDDVLLSIRGTNRKVAIFESNRNDVLMSQNFVGIRCSNSLLSTFLKLYLESPIAQFYFANHMAGSTVPNLPIKDINNLPVPVLSIKEQEEIVRKYEEESIDITKRIEELERRQKQLKLEAFEKMGLQDTFEIL
ncbi:N-6 DNA methylase [Bacillus cereus]|uniref:N-6 DNA methylase n=1 Tax=Bacillus cereus TaxID=1396 RepID=UPI0025A238D9|nr:N-6 DNA methylase [Bacillus cereus]MDM5461157.1 N-6 DNA methylase [Bacillus cereus]